MEIEQRTMKLKNLSEWLHVIGNFAVLAGLVVVAYEVRQSSVLARGELVATYNGHWQEIDRSKQDVGFAQVLSKAMDHPENLTSAEMIQLDGYYYSVIDQINIDRYLYNFGIFKEPHELAARDVARTILTNRFAQSWWHERREHFDPTTVGFIDDELEKVSGNAEQRFFGAIKSRLSEQ
jgi:hypothetical protein